MANPEGNAARVDKPKALARLGIASPAPLRDVLEAIDTAIVEMSGRRSDYLESIQDAFTPLRSSAQLFREIFYGVPLPLKSSADLIRRAGGPYKLIHISYKEVGSLVFALGDVIEAIPDFESVFPITDFIKLAAQLEDIREKDADSGATWFVGRIKFRFFRHIIEGHMDRQTRVDFSVVTRKRTPLAACSQCGQHHSPAAAVTAAFTNLAVQGSPIRWTGKPERTTSNG